MRVIGIDPGTLHLGWAILEQVGTKITHVMHGVVDTKRDAVLAVRLVQIDRALREVVECYKPDASAVEAIFYAKDPSAAAKLGHARGVVLLRMADAGLPIFEYEPTRVKRAVVGRGRADKSQVAFVVRSVLGLSELPRSDAADALAIALTHLSVARFSTALEETVKRQATRTSRRPAGRRPPGRQ